MIFCRRLYELIESNRGVRIVSQKNWRVEPQTNISDNNKSKEVILERAIAILGERGILPGWINQVPVASGLVNESADKRAAVDLVFLEVSRATFVELKWGPIRQPMLPLSFFCMGLFICSVT